MKINKNEKVRRKYNTCAVILKHNIYQTVNVSY